MSFCVNCGTRLQEGMRFCPKCGTPAGGQTVPQNQAEQQEKPVQEFRQPQMSQTPRANAGIKKPWQNASAQGMRGNAPQQGGVNVVPPTGGMRTVDDLMNFFLEWQHALLRIIPNLLIPWLPNQQLRSSHNMIWIGICWTY